MRYFEKVVKEYKAWKNSEPDNGMYGSFFDFDEDGLLVFKNDVLLCFKIKETQKILDWLNNPIGIFKITNGKKTDEITMEIDEDNHIKGRMDDAWEYETFDADLKKLREGMTKMMEMLDGDVRMKQYLGPDVGAIERVEDNDCDICLVNTKVVSFDDDRYDDDSDFVLVCKECLKKALEMLE